MGKHGKPKSTAKHAKTADHKTAKRVATFGAAAVSVPTLALTFTPSASATTQNIPRIVIPADDTPPADPPCEDYIVQRGDTLSGVAARASTTLDVVEPLNPGIIAGDRPDDYSLIFKGGHVHLPAGHCTVAAPAPPAPGHKHWHHGHKHWHHGHTPPPPPVSVPSDPPVLTPPPPPVHVGTTPVIAPDCPGTASGYCAHSPAYWGPLIEQAQALVGGNVANASVQSIEALMSAESSGDPNAINNYDSNAQNGDPSRGLMQTISATFNAYHVSGTSQNIYDPLANISAALSYINQVYGGSVPNSPY